MAKPALCLSGEKTASLRNREALGSRHYNCHGLEKNPSSHLESHAKRMHDLITLLEPGMDVAIVPEPRSTLRHKLLE